MGFVGRWGFLVWRVCVCGKRRRHPCNNMIPSLTSATANDTRQQL